MFDSYLPDHLLAVTTITNSRGTSRTSTIASGTNNRIYRGRVPESTAYPHIIVCEGQDIDVGQTADVDMTREIGLYNVLIIGKTFNSIDQIYRDVVDALRNIRNQYVPTSGSHKIWTQCVIIKDVQQFQNKILDGGQEPVLGYDILIKAGYDQT